MKKIVFVRDVPLGGGDIVIQSMTNTVTADVDATVKQVLELRDAGARLVRVSFPDMRAVETVAHLRELNVPIVADIHFDGKIAIAAVEAGVDKIRINPSNLSPSGIRSVVDCCREHNVPIRVGVNKGSIKEPNATPERLARLAMENVRLIEDLGYDKIVVAVKTSDVTETVHAYRILSKICDYPLHVGLTEAGTYASGSVKSAIAIGSLLLDGIGDTIRVSLTDDPVKEVYFAKKLLNYLGIDKNFVEIISCPTCSRTNIPVKDIASQLEELTRNVHIPMKIAVMGCVVNGIGESKGADFGVAGGKEKSSLICDGKIIGTVDNGEILATLTKMAKERLRG